MIQVATVKRVVAEHFKISVRELEGSEKADYVVRPRQLAMYLAVRMTRRPLGEIGQQFNRHHTTVIHTKEKIRARFRTDPELIATYRELRAKIGRRENWHSTFRREHEAARAIADALRELRL